jgi:hypothetical protein
MTQLVQNLPPPQQLGLIGRSRSRTEVFKDRDRRMKQSCLGVGAMSYQSCLLKRKVVESLKSDLYEKKCELCRGDCILSYIPGFLSDFHARFSRHMKLSYEKSVRGISAEFTCVLIEITLRAFNYQNLTNFRDFLRFSHWNCTHVCILRMHMGFCFRLLCRMGTHSSY